MYNIEIRAQPCRSNYTLSTYSWYVLTFSKYFWEISKVNVSGEEASCFSRKSSFYILTFGDEVRSCNIFD